MTTNRNQRRNLFQPVVFGLVLFGLIVAGGIATRLNQPPSPASAESGGLLSSAERQDLTARLIAMLQGNTSRQAMAELRRLAKRDGRVLASCHPLAHALGQAAFVKTNDFTAAMESADEFCNSGFIHGVIEARFAAGVDTAELLTICPDSTRPSRAVWQCFHGIGHGLMYASQNDLPWSLDECDRLPTSFTRGSCRNGVWMENFNADDIDHPSIYRRADDPLYPCTEQPVERRTDCYVYAPVYMLNRHHGDAGPAFAICATASSPDNQACAFGIGTELAKQNLDHLSRAAAACHAGGIQLRTNCRQGIFSYLSMHTGDNPSEMESLCRQLPWADRQLCYDTLIR